VPYSEQADLAPKQDPPSIPCVSGSEVTDEASFYRAKAPGMRNFAFALQHKTLHVAAK
jgi:hypothetical protein